MLAIRLVSARENGRVRKLEEEQSNKNPRSDESGKGVKAATRLKERGNTDDFCGP